MPFKTGADAFPAPVAAETSTAAASFPDRFQLTRSVLARMCIAVRSSGHLGNLVYSIRPYFRFILSVNNIKNRSLTHLVPSGKLSHARTGLIDILNVIPFISG